MKTNQKIVEYSDLALIEKLLQSMRHDPVIHRKVIAMLEMDPYPRRIVLSNWLEELRLHHAPHQLSHTLSYLFDDLIAEKVYRLIKRTRTKTKSNCTKQDYPNHTKPYKGGTK